MSKKLEGKVAVVTGASKGIGAGIAIELGKEGASVIVNYATSKEGADRVVSEIIKNGGQAIAIQANVAEEKDIQRLFSETVKKYKKVDILVNNAGVYQFGSLQDTTPEMFHKMFNLNVLGLLLTTKEAVKYFPSSGGSIINISSVASTLCSPDFSVYSATKASVDAITKCLSKELGSKQIRVNSVNPGLVETEGVHAMGVMNGDFHKEAVASSSLGRIGQPEDIAPAVAFLASDETSWMTGESLFISGGKR
jgi:3-oxoacyl-[acyl-carrier protein] reductase